MEDEIEADSKDMKEEKSLKASTEESKASGEFSWGPQPSFNSQLFI